MQHKDIFKLTWPPIPDDTVANIVELADKIDPLTVSNTVWGDFVMSLSDSADLFKKAVPGHKFISSGLIVNKEINGGIYKLYKDDFYPDLRDYSQAQLCTLAKDTDGLIGCVGPHGVLPNLITSRPLLQISCVAPLNFSETIKIYRPKNSDVRHNQLGAWDHNDVELIDEIVFEKNHWYAINYKDLIIEEVVNPNYLKRFRMFTMFNELQDLTYFEKYRKP